MHGACCEYTSVSHQLNWWSCALRSTLITRETHIGTCIVWGTYATFDAFMQLCRSRCVRRPCKPLSFLLLATTVCEHCFHIYVFYADVARHHARQYAFVFVFFPAQRRFTARNWCVHIFFLLTHNQYLYCRLCAHFVHFFVVAASATSHECVREIPADMVQQTNCYYLF